MTKYDELVELIQDIYRAGKEGRLPSISPQRLIALILSAVHDGLEIPGERGGRAHVGGFVADEWGNVAIVPDDDMGLQKGDLLIALRKEG